MNCYREVGSVSGSALLLTVTSRDSNSGERRAASGKRLVASGKWQVVGGQRAVPSKIGEELKYNPYMRIRSEAVRNFTGATNDVEVRAT